jgi:hypothetical protein
VLPRECPVSEFVLPWHYCATEAHPCPPPCPGFLRSYIEMQLSTKAVDKLGLTNVEGNGRFQLEDSRA